MNEGGWELNFNFLISINAFGRRLFTFDIFSSLGGHPRLPQPFPPCPFRPLTPHPMIRFSFLYPLSRFGFGN